MYPSLLQQPLLLSDVVDAAHRLPPQGELVQEAQLPAAPSFIAPPLDSAEVVFPESAPLAPKPTSDSGPSQPGPFPAVPRLPESIEVSNTYAAAEFRGPALSGIGELRTQLAPQGRAVMGQAGIAWDVAGDGDAVLAAGAPHGVDVLSWSGVRVFGFVRGESRGRSDGTRSDVGSVGVGFDVGGLMTQRWRTNLHVDAALDRHDFFQQNGRGAWGLQINAEFDNRVALTEHLGITASGRLYEADGLKGPDTWLETLGAGGLSWQSGPIGLRAEAMAGRAGDSDAAHPGHVFAARASATYALAENLQFSGALTVPLRMSGFEGSMPPSTALGMTPVNGFGWQVRIAYAPQLEEPVGVKKTEHPMVF